MRFRAALGRLFPRWRDFQLSRSEYLAVFGHSPRFFFAKTFTEKVQRRKILDRDPRLSICSDKVFVKDFVAQKLGPRLDHPDKMARHIAAVPAREEMASAFRTEGQSRRRHEYLCSISERS